MKESRRKELKQELEKQFEYMKKDGVSLDSYNAMLTDLVCYLSGYAPEIGLRDGVDLVMEVIKCNL